MMCDSAPGGIRRGVIVTDLGVYVDVCVLICCIEVCIGMNVVSLPPWSCF